jgi:hypothetical protein
MERLFTLAYLAGREGRGGGEIQTVVSQPSAAPNSAALYAGQVDISNGVSISLFLWLDHTYSLSTQATRMEADNNYDI